MTCSSVERFMSLVRIILASWGMFSTIESANVERDGAPAKLYVYLTPLMLDPRYISNAMI